MLATTWSAMRLYPRFTGVLSSSDDRLSAKERRHLRHERREASSAAAGSWREQVEERLLHKPKKKPASSWTDELNIDNLSRLGPQWWVIRVSRTNGHYTAERLARALALNFPQIEFKLYLPAVKEQRKLKNGSISTKLNPLFPGCVFLHCILNKDIHDFIREADGVGGFVGSTVGNSKRQINKPKPVPINEMEAIFQQAKEDQKKFDETSKEEQLKETNHNVSEAVGDSPKRKLKKTLKPSDDKSLRKGANVQILSGPFSGFTGCIKELNLKGGKVKVSFELFGKDNIVDLEVNQVALETT